MPQVRFEDGGVLHTAASIKAKQAGTIQTIQRIRAMVGGVLQTVYQFFTASLSTSLVAGNYYGSSPAAQDITTASVNAIVAGGVGPFTYAWSRTDAGPDTWTILSPTSAATAFKATSVPNGVQAIGSFECVVTDTGAGSATATTPSVSAEANNNSTA